MLCYLLAVKHWESYFISPGCRVIIWKMWIIWESMILNISTEGIYCRELVSLAWGGWLSKTRVERKHGCNNCRKEPLPLGLGKQRQEWGYQSIEAQGKSCEEPQGARALILDVGAPPADAGGSKKAQWHWGCLKRLKAGTIRCWLRRPATDRRYIIHITIREPLLPSSGFSVSLWCPQLAEVTEIGWQRKMSSAEPKAGYKRCIRTSDTIV